MAYHGDVAIPLFLAFPYLNGEGFWWVLDAGLGVASKNSCSLYLGSGPVHENKFEDNGSAIDVD